MSVASLSNLTQTSPCQRLSAFTSSFLHPWIKKQNNFRFVGCTTTLTGSSPLIKHTCSLSFLPRGVSKSKQSSCLVVIKRPPLLMKVCQPDRGRNVHRCGGRKFNSCWLCVWSWLKKTKHSKTSLWALEVLMSDERLLLQRLTHMHRQVYGWLL